MTNPFTSNVPMKGLARALSKLGFCSRQQAAEVVRAGRVSVNGAVRRDPEWRVRLGRDQILVDGGLVRSAKPIYLMLNKPRGLVTTTCDEKGRATVFSCLQPYAGTHLAAVGRLDKASEGLLLFSNDTEWAARLTEPRRGVLKKYHVQVKCVASQEFAIRMQEGVKAEGEWLTCASVRILRAGTDTSWLEVGLDEGRNRHIRRLLESLGVEVLRLVRVAIGPLPLGSLKKGEFRILTVDEVEMLRALGS